MTTLLTRFWQKIREPRVISVAYFFLYLSLFAGGISALVDPPKSVEGHIGELSMTVLAAMLTFGGAVGAPSALFGIWWLERTAVFAIAMSALIYSGIIVALHYTGTGNRLLQLSFVGTVLIMQVVPRLPIRPRPYAPDRHF